MNEVALPLAGRTALVTGSSRGIGYAIAKAFAVAGADVIVHSRANLELADQIAEEFRSLGRQALPLIANLNSADERDRLAATAWNWQNGIDVLVNNAGVDVLTTELSRRSFEERLAALWEVDVRGTVFLSRTLGAEMQSRWRTGGARSASGGTTNLILNIGWDQAEHGMGGVAGEMFSTIKGAVMAFSKSLAQTLAPAVRVNCLAPGWIRTAWGEEASSYWQERAQSESLMGRWGHPEDVAHVARFLASDEASFITGQTIPINGGWKRSIPSGPSKPDA